MPEYIVKEGAKTFSDGALRSAGYVVRKEKAIEPYPSWAEPQAAAAKAAAKPKAAPKKDAAPATEEAPAADGVSFTDADLKTNPTIQL